MEEEVEDEDEDEGWILHEILKFTKNFEQNLKICRRSIGVAIKDLNYCRCIFCLDHHKMKIRYSKIYNEINIRYKRKYKKQQNS
jgi:hypothetical protein